MAVTNVGFSVQAAADFLGNGSIEVPIFEREIMDAVRRGSVLRQRVPAVPSTGQPHRYIEQTAIATAGFTDPRNIVPAPSGPTRVERPVFIKGITGQSNFSMVDVEVAEQQNVFGDLLDKDINDIAEGIIVTSGTAMWTGNDTSLASPTTIQYMGLLSQITLQATVASGASIVDAVKAEVAQIVANPSFNVTPTAIYCNPVGGDYLDREGKAANVTFGEVEVVAGVKVRAIQTQAGLLPIIGDAFLPAATAGAYGFAAPPTGLKNYFFVIVCERFLERPYVSGRTRNPNPRIFRLGLQSNLAGQYVGVMFDAVVAKGAAYAHAIVAVQRP